MNYRRFGRTELQVSEIALGALEIGAKYGIGEECGDVPSEDEANALMKAALDAGITLFDTAGVYGLSEARIGKFLKGITADRPVLTSKLSCSRTDDGQILDYAAERPYPTVNACVDHMVERTLRNLGVDVLDVMQFHGVRDDGMFEDMTDALKAHVKAGRIRFIGASCAGSSIPRLVEAGGFSTVQVCYNALEQEERNRALKLAEEHDLGVLIRTPLALGVLADKVDRLDEERRQRFSPFLDELRSRLPKGMTVPEAALRFVVSSPAVSAALCGTRRAPCCLGSVACVEVTPDVCENDLGGTVLTTPGDVFNPLEPLWGFPCSFTVCNLDPLTDVIGGCCVNSTTTAPARPTVKVLLTLRRRFDAEHDAQATGDELGGEVHQDWRSRWLAARDHRQVADVYCSSGCPPERVPPLLPRAAPSLMWLIRPQH